MRAPRRQYFASLWLAASALAGVAAPAAATDLVDAWHAAQLHDLDFATSRAEQQSGEARRSQAGALWRPTVSLSGTAGVAGSETAVNGAQFTAPGLGRSDGVAFNTSVNRGTLGRWVLSASLPLISRERDAQGKQLVLSADVADLEWQEAQQTLMLTTAQRYFDVVLAADALRVLRQQQVAVISALTETQDRFRLGDVPVTDTFEATARVEAITAQGLALETDLQLKQAAFTDATGLQANTVQWMAPGPTATPISNQTLAFWVAESEARNFALRMQLTAVEVATQEAAKFSGALSPSLDLVAQVGRERLSGSGDFGNASNSSGNRIIGLQLSVPLYTGGMRSAREHEALRGVDKIRAQTDRTRQQVVQQTRTAWLGLTVGVGRIAALSQALVSTRSRLDATRLGRQVGDRTTLDLLNAENDAASAELTLMQARVEFLMNRLRLAAAAGRLDEAWLHLVNASLQPLPNR